MDTLPKSKTQCLSLGSLEADLEKKTPMKMIEAKKEYSVKQSSKRVIFLSIPQGDPGDPGQGGAQ